ncbi:AAA domain-containing protein [Streptomyces sp. 1331.2]|nr:MULTISPECIES: ATP-binding protein [unclassified Streptomyces]SOB79449.1 AAA domain-containing protein [Streptomyces sp. 1331.2]
MGGTRTVRAAAVPRVPPPRPAGDRVVLPPAHDAPVLHELRGPGPAALRYPAGDLLVVTGLPGSGKSTLMRRCVRAPMIDSQLVREEYAARLPGRLPYALYRPLARLAHYRRLRRAVLAGGPLVVHDCGTLPWVRAWLARAAAGQGRRVHLLLLDADPAEALDGQRRRGRTVSRYAFARHRAVAARLRERILGAGRLPADCASAVVLDRAAARALREIDFTAS